MKTFNRDNNFYFLRKMIIIEDLVLERRLETKRNSVKKGCCHFKFKYVDDPFMEMLQKGP